MRFDEHEAVSSWWEWYVATYLERDLRQLSQVASLSDFRRVMSAIALRCGNVVNQSEVARNVGVSQPTVHRYTGLLATTCLMSGLPAYAVNRTKRLVKSPKVMWTDPGLVSFLLGYFKPDSVRGSREAGALFESMVYLHLVSLSQLITPRPHLLYWRTVGGQEVDFVLEWGRKVVAIEAKLGSDPRYRDTRGLRAFSEEYPEVAACVLLHTGTAIRRMDEKVIALPWHVLLGT
jgi:predicted AAA+ superfamily ATPase